MLDKYLLKKHILKSYRKFQLGFLKKKKFQLIYFNSALHKKEKIILTSTLIQWFTEDLQAIKCQDSFMFE